MTCTSGTLIELIYLLDRGNLVPLWSRVRSRLWQRTACEVFLQASELSVPLEPASGSSTGMSVILSTELQLWLLDGFLLSL